MPDQKKKYYFLSYRHKRFSWDWESAARFHRCLDVHPLTWLSEQYNEDMDDSSRYNDMYEITFWTELTKEEYDEHKKIYEECRNNTYPEKQVTANKPAAINKPNLSRAD